MRIGVFTYGIFGERMTGIARYAVELTRALRRVDPTLEITLLNPYPADPHPWYREFPTYPLPLLSSSARIRCSYSARKVRPPGVHEQLDVHES